MNCSGIFLCGHLEHDNFFPAPIFREPEIFSKSSAILQSTYFLAMPVFSKSQTEKPVFKGTLKIPQKKYAKLCESMRNYAKLCENYAKLCEILTFISD